MHEVLTGTMRQDPGMVEDDFQQLIEDLHPVRQEDQQDEEDEDLHEDGYWMTKAHALLPKIVMKRVENYRR